VQAKVNVSVDTVVTSILFLGQSVSSSNLYDFTTNFIKTKKENKKIEEIQTNLNSDTQAGRRLDRKTNKRNDRQSE
jgi:hypothetical protein